MSYTIDVYMGKIRPERNFLGFCNYIAYLPQLIAGPIERFSNLYPQITAFNAGKAESYWSAGVDRIALGLIQKLIIADSCGIIVDRLLNADINHDFITAWVVSIGFGMQIYFDFAAYTHIAIGISLILGIRLQENFNSPYQACNIREFWRRWHMTLSRWFRDYLYIPLGGSREGHFRTVINILLTFLLVGLWHGAGWNYVFWGALHGCMLTCYYLKTIIFPQLRINHFIGVFITFTLVHIAWVPFRAGDISDIFVIWNAMLGKGGFNHGYVSDMDIVFVAIVTFSTLIFPNASRRWPGNSGWHESACIWLLAVFAIFNSPAINKFIYFQF
ncbi:MAG: MBOAT family O-acyltransferase [Gammaproteobacteria bacterium]